MWRPGRVLDSIFHDRGRRAKADGARRRLRYHAPRVAGLVALSGFDGLIFSISFLVGWPVVMFLIAVSD